MSEPCRLVCPRCRGELIFDVCLGCGARYRALRGILDLRTADDEYMPNAADWEFALRLNDDYDRLDFRGLLERYFDLSPAIPADLRKRQIDHILTAPERARQWLEVISGASDSLDMLECSPLLDLGCGTGSFLAASLSMSRAPEPSPSGEGKDNSIRHAHPWGIDIALRWLLIARKRLDEGGYSAVGLVCGCAEGLPFADGTFRTIVAGDVIEHVADQGATLAEAHRVLLPRGRLFLASPNRYSLAPEPHVQVWGVGFLPRPWMALYVHWVRKMDFSAIRTLGQSEWRRLLQRSPFQGGSLYAPALPAGDLALFRPVKRSLARLYNAVVSHPLGQRAALACGPLFHVYCVRHPDSPAPTANPAIRPHSRPSEAPV